MSAGNFLDELGLAHPSLVGVYFIFGNNGERSVLLEILRTGGISEMKCTKIRKGVRRGSTKMVKTQFKARGPRVARHIPVSRLRTQWRRMGRQRAACREQLTLPALKYRWP